MLKETFIELVTKYTDNESLVNELWAEVEKNYSNKKRYYHNLQHLENLLVQLTEVKGEIQNWNIILFTLFYHYVIYNPLKSDNEEKSADLAEKRIKQLAFSEAEIKLCKNQIHATKTHIKSTDNDTNYFTDVDLSILGQSWEAYSHYYKNVRKEYGIYPDFIYNPGRKKVLNHFLSMERMFETEAKNNLQKELNIL